LFFVNVVDPADLIVGGDYFFLFLFGVPAMLAAATYSAP
jgi:hypothetical protein